MRRVNSICVFLCAGLLANCSIVDLGEIDYRKAETATDPAQSVASYGVNCAVQQTSELADPATAKFRRGSEKQCKPVLAGRLFRKNISTGSRIEKNDVYSIRLEHGLIAFMTEPGFDPSRLLYDTKRMGRQLGEIVVLANVFEFGDAESANGFRSISDIGSAKVVYYSPDVEAHQDLNFSNIPLKEPSTYNGNPVGIQIVVLELDRMSEQMQSLLRTLAAFGQQSNLAPSGAVGGLLLKLGTSMLTQNNDDTIFEYRFVLDPSDGTVAAKSAAFEEGRYVIKRTDERRDDQIWRNLVVDHNDGRLMRLGTRDKAQVLIGPVPYDDETYFTLNVIKHPPGTTPSSFGMKTFDQLGEEIKAASARRDVVFTEIKQDLDRKLVELRQSNRAEELGKAWSTAAEKYRTYARIYLKPEARGQCTLASNYEQKLQLAQFEAQQAAIGFAKSYKAALDEQVSDQEKLFGEKEQRNFLSMLAPYFLPQVPGSVTMAELTNPAQFNANYGADNFTALNEAMRQNAEQQWASRSCSDLAAMQLATLPAGDGQ